MLEDYAPAIPDFAHDQHTMKGKAWAVASIISARKARCWYRRRPSRDPYEDEAYRLWAIKQRGK